MTLTISSAVGDVMAGTSCPKVGRQNLTNKERLIRAPLDGVGIVPHGQHPAPTSLERVVMFT
ncbi:MAG: hypothetical protein F4Y18_03770 [Cenarchaeum sp. SB0663_bin_5]|nr:hypothetical protein [Cenarchaeum sp. SB0663_bin_5]MYH04306.1 hypothetical protein [Cenarchaeum sp. SB0675_bin_21]